MGSGLICAIFIIDLIFISIAPLRSRQDNETRTHFPPIRGLDNGVHLTARQCGGCPALLSYRTYSYYHTVVSASGARRRYIL
jgi:hypothetical protein